MKLQMSREHYYTTNSGATWVPKLGFDTLEELLATGMKSGYLCGVCSRYHYGRKPKHVS